MDVNHYLVPLPGTNLIMPYNSDPASGQISSVYSFPEPKPNQHLRLTLNEVIDQYQKKLIKATTLVYYAVKIYRQDGQKLRVKDVNAFCQRLGINRSTFYKAVKNLEEANVGFRSAPSDGATLWIEESPLGDTESPLGDTESPLGDTESPLGDTESPLGENETSKPSPDKASSSSSNIYQISINSLSEEERESFEKFVREEWKKKTGSEIDSFTAFVRGDYFQEWWDKYTRATGKFDWETHPKFSEWLAEIRRTNKQVFVLFSKCSLAQQERQQLVSWVEAKGLLEVAV